MPADPLARAAAEVVDLLDLVDRSLRRYGVPPGHPALAGMLEYRALPGELARALVDTDPGPVAGAADRLARLGVTGTEMDEAVRRDIDVAGWQGPAGDAFRRAAGSVSGTLSATADALTGTAGYGKDLARWLGDLRTALAGFFAREAAGPASVLLRTGPVGAGGAGELVASGELAEAAADLAAGCYAALRPALAAGRELRDRTEDPRWPGSAPPGGRPTVDPPPGAGPVPGPGGAFRTDPG